MLARLLRALGGLGVAGVALLLDAVGGLLRGEEGGGLGPRLVLEIDVIALVGQFARGDLADRPLRLEGAQDAEIVFGVLEVVLGQNPVARRTGVAGQLLVALVDGLGVAADLDVLGTLRVPRTVGVRRIGIAATAATGFPVATALTLHALEISHRGLPCWFGVSLRDCGEGVRPVVCGSGSLGGQSPAAMLSEGSSSPVVVRWR